MINACTSSIEPVFNGKQVYTNKFEHNFTVNNQDNVTIYGNPVQDLDVLLDYTDILYFNNKYVATFKDGNNYYINASTIDNTILEDDDYEVQVVFKRRANDYYELSLTSTNNLPNGNYKLESIRTYTKK